MAGKRVLTDDAVEAASRMYADGRSMKAIADSIGVGYTAVRGALKRNGVPIRDCRCGPITPTKLSDAQISEAVQRYNNGETSTSLAKEYGLAHSTLQTHLRRSTEMRQRGAGSQHGERNRFYRGGRRAVTRVHNQVYAAIQEGVLIRPDCCEECGGKGIEYSNGKASIHAHHDDYNKPLEVRWLCQWCHHKWHEQNVAIAAR